MAGFTGQSFTASPLLREGTQSGQGESVSAIALTEGVQHAEGENFSASFDNVFIEPDIEFDATPHELEWVPVAGAARLVASASPAGQVSTPLDSSADFIASSSPAEQVSTPLDSSVNFIASSSPAEQVSTPLAPSAQVIAGAVAVSLGLITPDALALLIASSTANDNGGATPAPGGQLVRSVTPTTLGWQTVTSSTPVPVPVPVSNVIPPYFGGGGGDTEWPGDAPRFVRDTPESSPHVVRGVVIEPMVVHLTFARDVERELLVAGQLDFQGRESTYGTVCFIVGLGLGVGALAIVMSRR